MALLHDVVCQMHLRSSSRRSGPPPSSITTATLLLVATGIVVGVDQHTIVVQARQHFNEMEAEGVSIRAAMGGHALLVVKNT